MFGLVSLETVDGMELRLFECGYAKLRNCGAGSDGTKHGRKRGGEWVDEVSS